MTEIILARHGETEWNVKEVFRSRADVGLNETGLKQAELLGRHLSKLPIEAVYSSPLKRAFTTAEPVSRHHKLEVKISPGLIDFDYGKWQGLSLQEVKDKYQPLYDKWRKSPHLVEMPGGESLDMVRERALKVLSEILSEHSGAVALVSHRVVNKVLICALLGLDNSHFWNVKQDTAGATTFLCEDGRFVLTSHNDTSYLNTLHKEPLGDF